MKIKKGIIGMVSILSMVVIAGITCVVNQSSGSEKKQVDVKKLRKLYEKTRKEKKIKQTLK